MFLGYLADDRIQIILNQEAGLLALLLGVKYKGQVAACPAPV